MDLLAKVHLLIKGLFDSRRLNFKIIRRREMIKAVKTKLTIKRLHKDKVTEGGIHLSYEDNPNPQAEVLSVGEEVKANVKPGDVIFLDWRYVLQLTFDDNKVYVMDEGNILAVES
jgi:co-chaperonin GroES (HSP10)